jgi:1-acylglycerone phosphate reductase
MEMERIKSLFEVNVFGLMNMCHSFIPLLRASKHPGGARIVNIGSITGIMPRPFGAAYNASKAAVHAYGDTLRVELEPFG